MTPSNSTEDRAPQVQTLAQRIGVLFVLALQNNDAELREAAYIDKAELSFHGGGGPVFLPVEALKREKGEKP